MSAAIAPIAQALFESLYPLVLAADNRDYRDHLLRQLGWDEDAAAELFVLGPQFVDWWQRGLEHQDALAKALKAKDGESQFLHAMLLLEIAFELSDAIAARQGQPSDGPLEPGVRQALWSDLARALPEYLLLRWLRLNQPFLYWLLRVTDVVDLDMVDANAPARVAAAVPRLRPERIGPLLSDTEAYLKGRYDWGSDRASLGYPLRHDPQPEAPLRHRRLLQVLQRLFSDLGLRPRLAPVRQRHQGSDGPPSPDLLQLILPLVQGRKGSGPWIQIGIELLPISGTRGPAIVDGLYLANLSRGGTAGTFPLNPTWTLSATAGLEVSGALALRLLPGEVTVETALPSSGVEFRAIGEPVTPWVLLGSNTGSRLELHGAEVGLAVEQVASELEVRLFFEPTRQGGGPALLFSLAPAEGDSFVQELIGAEDLQIAVDLSVEWSNLRGLRLNGGDAGFCFTVPLGLYIGPITIDALHLCLSAGSEGLDVMALVTAAARLGPVVCSVKDIGMAFQLGWAGGSGSGKAFGVFTLEAGFRPPAGVGLGIESALVQAGGYLEFDRALGEYSGTAAVGIASLALTAVGSLVVDLPDPPGWSLLLTICAEFTPLPLGFGFTLNGVGGLIGVGRTVDVKAMRRQLAAGALDAVMFPPDPVANGPAIIATIRDLFPVCQGQTVFGPMVKIGWGAPTLFEADLGVLIELPEPIQVVLIGQISSELPTRTLGLVRLHLDAMGVFNFSESSLSISAVLYDSWIVGLSLFGSMELRGDFGPDPSFLFALGGFHPRFRNARGFPPMKRLSIGLDFGEDLKVVAKSYLALTAGMIMYGASVDVVANLRILTLKGGAGFDTLIRFSPFSFVARFYAHMSVLLGSKELLGVAIVARFSGPEPWFFMGTASFRVLYKDWNFDVEIKLAGKETAVKLETLDVAALVRDALRLSGAWSQTGTAAAGVQLVVRDRTADADDDLAPMALPTLLLRPDLDVEVRQRVAPLAVEMEKFGNQAISGPRRIDIESVSFGAISLGRDAAMVGLDEWFAPAEYFEMTESERLDAPSFDRMRAGERLVVGGFSQGESMDHSMAHEYSVIDREMDHKLSRSELPHKGRGRLGADHAAARHVTRNAMARQGRRVSAVAPSLTLQPERWRVIDTGSEWLSPPQSSFSEALELMHRQRLQRPSGQHRLRVVPVSAMAVQP